MYPTAGQLRAIAGSRAKVAIVEGVSAGLHAHGPAFGLDRPHRLAHFICQIGHESAGFSTTAEFASGKAYEGRKDLGNTQKGDGPRFKGHGLIQTTGRANHREFTKWARARDPAAPDFEALPEKLMEFPWALLSALYYWDSRKLNDLADANNIEMITKRINGGLNGYADRITLYERTALTMLGYGTDASGVKAFQTKARIEVDGLTGPKTRTALHEAVEALGRASTVEPAPDPTRTSEPAVAPPAGSPASARGRLTALTLAMILVVIAVVAAALFL